MMVASALLLLFGGDCALNPNRLDELTSVAHTYPEFLLVGVAISLILVGFLGAFSLQSWRMLRYLGKISYGLYVYHLPCILILLRVIPRILRRDSPVAVLLIGLPLMVGVASISYRYLEMPFLRLKERFETVKSRAA